MEMIARLKHSTRLRERRRYLRVTPDPLLVIRFSSGNTGIVLDVSREGLGFLASAPLEETGVVRFEISGRSTPRSEAAGRMMWKDRTGKRAGVQFTELTEELQALIRGRLPATEIPRAIRNEPATATPKSFFLEEPVRDVSRQNSKRMIFFANTVTCALACLIALGIWQSVDRRGAAGLAFPWKHEMTRLSSQLRTLLGGIGLPKPVQNAQPTSAERPKLAAPSGSVDVPLQTPSATEKQPAPTAAPASLASSARLDAPKSAQPKTAEPAKPAAPIAEKHAALPIPKVANQAPLARAQELLQTDADPEKQVAGVQLLWQAVAKGDVTAEVTLAGLYLSGQGVAKNCEQARVLLKAAQNRKSEQAGEKLGELSKYGCE